MAQESEVMTDRITRERRAATNETGDPLSALAPLLRVRPVLDLVCRFGGGWASPHEAETEGWAQFHILTKGECLIERAEEPPVLLRANDILLLPHGDAHILRARRGRSRRPADIITEVRNAIRVQRVEGTPVDTELICGRLKFEGTSQSLLTAALPPMIVLHPADWPDHQRLLALLETIRDEIDGDRPGARAIATDVASALLIMMIRGHLAHGGLSDGFLRLLGERHAGRAALAMLDDVARDWTLDDLAGTASTSRASLVRAFRAATGMAPLAFLTDLRMGMARQQIGQGATPLAQIAANVGYQSESALSRAMQRHFGVRPSDFRRRGEEKYYLGGEASD